MEVIMANNKTLFAAVLGWAIITLAVVGSPGFYFGLKYEQTRPLPRGRCPGRA
jgi:hypothetical protein